MAKKQLLAMLVAVTCLVICCGSAHASENETEMTGGFVPVGLSSGTGSSGSSGADTGSAGEQAETTPQESNGI